MSSETDGLAPRPRVLIVDDAPENIRMLMGFLGKMCSVQAATSGIKALEFARGSPKPDLILLDVMMPEMSGYDVCMELKRNQTTQSIPVIFVTGLNDVADEERGLAMGAVDYISKPFHAELVRARVSNHLELKRHRDHLEREVKERKDELVTAQRLQQRLQSELDVASRLQRSMLPEPLSGGKRPTEFALATYLLMVQVRTLARSLATRSTSPADLLVQLNEELCRDNQACMFVTVVCGYLHQDSGKLEMARGGHEHPVLIDCEGKARFLEFEGGPALGLCPGAHFPNFSSTLEAGEHLVLYTDGVTEAANPAHELYGEERLLQVLERAGGQEPGELLETMKASLADFVCGAEASDDITLLVLRKTLVT